MLQRYSLSVLVVALIAVLLMAGCGGRKAPVETVPVQEPPPPAPAQPAPVKEPPAEVTESFPSQPVESRPIVEPTIDELNRQGVLKTVYFEFDRSDLDDSARAILRRNAEWLQANPKRRIVIEGHCDERGTIEYNLALGERRAKTVRDYLTSLGVGASRLRIVSYGEERPAVPGSSERAWSRNRRADFLIEA